MKREDIKARQAEDVVFDTHVIANPTNTREWIVFFKKGAGKSYFLVDDSEAVESFISLDDLIDDLKLMGIKRAEIHC